MIHQTIARATAIAALFLLGACSGSSSSPSDPCAPAAIPAGLGCEFWPTVTANAVDGDLAFGVALTNSGTAAASVHIEGGPLGAGIDLMVPAGTSAHRTLPWVNALKACTATGAPCTGATGTSVVASGGAYHVTSTQPIAAYQFSPALGTFDAVSADATALPGAHALGKGYAVVSWGATDAGGATALPGLVAVTAVADGTTVGITPSVEVAAGQLPALAAHEWTAVTMNRGDVVELLAYAGDLTGTYIAADKPVQVIGGHFCALVPAGAGYCDHLEEVVPPGPALGTSYVVVPPTPLTGAPVVVRILANAPTVALSYAPAIAGAPATLASGQYADFTVSAPVLITASGPVLVAEYMEGGSIGGVGDPSLAIATPVSRWRTSYAVEIPEIPGGGHVDVIAPAGASVRYDGAPLGFGPPDATGYVTSTIGFSGTMRLEGDRPFGVSTYGLGTDWSFWYAPAFAP